MFNSGFSEGSSCTSKKENNLNSVCESRRTINIEIDYAVFHNILYYLYTGVVTFDTHPYTTEITGEMYTIDVESLFAAADLLLLFDLKKLIFKFLRRTCDVDNITSRVFSPFARLHSEVDKFYCSYFKAHLVEVMDTRSYGDFFRMVDDSPDAEFRDEVNSKFRELVQEQFKDSARNKRRRLK